MGRGSGDFHIPYVPHFNPVVRQKEICLKIIDFASRPPDIDLHVWVSHFSLSDSRLPCEGQGIGSRESRPPPATGSDEEAMPATSAASD